MLKLARKKSLDLVFSPDFSFNLTTANLNFTKFCLVQFSHG